jgi:hypothetical protein
MKIHHIVILLLAFAARTVLAIAIFILALSAAYNYGRNHPTPTAAAATIQAELQFWNPAAKFFVYQNENNTEIDIANVNIRSAPDVGHAYMCVDEIGRPATNHLFLTTDFRPVLPHQDIADFAKEATFGTASIVPAISADGSQNGYDLRFTGVTWTKEFPDSKGRKTVLLHLEEIGRFEAVAAPTPVK